MHPDLLRALGKAHHADLLRHQEFRELRAHRSPRHARRWGTSISWMRRIIGATLVGAGMRLLRDNETYVDLLNGPS